MDVQVVLERKIPIRRQYSPLLILMSELTGLTALANTDETITNLHLIITDTKSDLRGDECLLENY